MKVEFGREIAFNMKQLVDSLERAQELHNKPHEEVEKLQKCIQEARDSIAAEEKKKRDIEALIDLARQAEDGASLDDVEDMVKTVIESSAFRKRGETACDLYVILQPIYNRFFASWDPLAQPDAIRDVLEESKRILGFQGGYYDVHLFLAVRGTVQHSIDAITKWTPSPESTPFAIRLMEVLGATLPVNPLQRISSAIAQVLNATVVRSSTSEFTAIHVWLLPWISLMEKNIREMLPHVKSAMQKYLEERGNVSVVALGSGSVSDAARLAPAINRTWEALRPWSPPLMPRLSFLSALESTPAMNEWVECLGACATEWPETAQVPLYGALKWRALLPDAAFHRLITNAFF